MSSEELKIETKSKRIFFNKLADLLDDYDVAICSTKEGDYTKVVFQVHDKRKGKTFLKENITNDRLHNTAYDIRWLAQEF